MKDVRELQEKLDHLRDTIQEARTQASKLANDRLIDPSSIPKRKLKLRDMLRDF
ncbi:hypothetical protein [Kineosporia babensis]|uniref:Uncharacterized protein n=1 Tax=Kineosporia babensis TaxID=499548 RepID=A0A9X1NI92_9ACTN|nr:hypothetical protein [Kineosporia babensis]MCD5314266.1 hypothetical protein [Kineosporia babensis]